MNQKLIDDLTRYAENGEKNGRYMYPLSRTECLAILELAGQFDRFCKALCDYCRGAQPDTDPTPVRVTDWMRNRDDYVSAYVHMTASGHRCLCGASAIRLLEDGATEQANATALDTSPDWPTAAKKAVKKLAARRGKAAGASVTAE